PEIAYACSVYAAMRETERTPSRQSVKPGYEVPTPHPPQSLVALHSWRSTRRWGSMYGSGLNASALTMLKTVTFAPMPSAREMSATAVNVFDLPRLRNANRMSLSSESTISLRLETAQSGLVGTAANLSLAVKEGERFDCRSPRDA